MGDETYLAHELLDLSVSKFVATRVNTIHFHPEVALDTSPAQNRIPKDHLIRVTHRPGEIDDAIVLLLEVL